MGISGMVILTFLAVILLFLVLILFSKIKVAFEVKKAHKEKIVTNLKITVLGKIDISLKNLSKKEKKEPKKEKKKNKKKFLQKIKDWIETFSILKKVYAKNRFFIKKRLILEETEVSIKFGTGDAPFTGILTGAIWSLLYQGLAFLGSVGTVREHEFDVSPVYDEKGLILSAKGIISFRLINIIIVALRVLITYKSVKRKRKN